MGRARVLPQLMQPVFAREALLGCVLKLCSCVLVSRLDLRFSLEEL